LVAVICRSKIMTGIPAARDFSIEGWIALKSTAASTMALGLRLMTSFIWLCCTSVLLSALRVTSS
jgi:hypothetical protein